MIYIFTGTNYMWDFIWSGWTEFNCTLIQLNVFCCKLELSKKADGWRHQKFFCFNFDEDLSLHCHIKWVTSSLFLHLCNIRKIITILTQEDAENLIHAFVTFRLDYFNGLLSCCPECCSLSINQNWKQRSHITSCSFVTLLPEFRLTCCFKSL